MFNSIREELESTVTPIMRDILQDARELMRQEAELVRGETRRESKRVAQVVTLALVGFLFAFSAIVLGLFSVVYTIAASTERYSLGLTFSLVALGAALFAAGISYLGLRKWRSLAAESERTFDAMKEGVAWMRRAM